MAVGLGWHIVERNGHRFATTNGQTGGYAAFAGFDMATGLSVVVLSNAARSVNDIGWYILDPSMPLQTSSAPVRREVTLPVSELDRFVGQYAASSVGVITITRNNDSLWARFAGLSYGMFAEGQRTFFLKAVDVQIVFAVDTSGNVTSLTLRYDGMELPAPKVR